MAKRRAKRKAAKTDAQPTQALAPQFAVGYRNGQLVRAYSEAEGRDGEIPVPSDDLDRLYEWVADLEVAVERLQLSDDALHVELERIREWSKNAPALFALMVRSEANEMAKLARDPKRQRDVMLGYLLGRKVERLISMRHEADALRGKDQSKRAVKVGKTRELLREDQQRTAAAEVHSLVESGIPAQTAAKQLVEKYGVSYKTLLRCYRRWRQP